jgi:hypothetical protein
MASIAPSGEGWHAHRFVAARRESRLFRLRRDADRWAAERENELSGSGAATTFAGAAERGLAQHLPELGPANSQRATEHSIRDCVLPEIGSRRFEALRPVDRFIMCPIERARSGLWRSDDGSFPGRRITRQDPYKVRSCVTFAGARLRASVPWADALQAQVESRRVVLGRLCVSERRLGVRLIRRASGLFAALSLNWIDTTSLSLAHPKGPGPRGSRAVGH